MLKSTLFFILSWSILALVPVSTLSPTPIQQFLVIPEYDKFMTKLWHIGDDIIGFYGLTERGYVDQGKPEGYLKVSPKTAEVKRILDDTIASCHKNTSLLDRSHYYPSISKLLYYCVSNNSLLIIETENYTVQDAISVSTSQTFQEVIVGHNEKGQIYILGLPDILSVPATNASELVLINLETKAVENHVIFNKDSDSQSLVTGYATDSGISYILTKGLAGDKTLIEISKIALTENDYDLTPFVNFTYEKESIVHVTHIPLDIIGGYLFTNDKNNLLVFDKNGNLFLNQTNLETKPFQKQDSSVGILWAPVTAAQSGGSTFYAYFLGFQAFSYSLQNGVMNSSLLDPRIWGMKIALGNGDGQDLLINLGVNSFFIKDISTNTTLYTSLKSYNDLMASSSYYFALEFQSLYVFDRQVSGKLLQTLKMPEFTYHDKKTNLLLGLSQVNNGCQITYMDLETLAVRNGPFISNKKACSSFGVIYINITDTARPFLIVQSKDEYLFVSPATYGTVSWTFLYSIRATGVVIPGEEGTSFSVVYTFTDQTPNNVQVMSYKLNKLIKRFILQDSYNLTTVESQQRITFYPIIDTKVVMSYGVNKLALFNLNDRSTVTYDVPASYNSADGVRVFYDKNKKPYLTLSEDTYFGQVTTLPQLFDFTNIMPMPEAIANLTRSAIVIGPCSYAVTDAYNDNIGVVRLYETCNSTQTEKIYT